MFLVFEKLIYFLIVKIPIPFLVDKIIFSPVKNSFSLSKLQILKYITNFLDWPVPGQQKTFFLLRR